MHAAIQLSSFSVKSLATLNIASVTYFFTDHGLVPRSQLGSETESTRDTTFISRTSDTISVMFAICWENVTSVLKMLEWNSNRDQEETLNFCESYRFNGAEINCRIAHNLGILLMNSNCFAIYFSSILVISFEISISFFKNFSLKTFLRKTKNCYE